MFDDGLKHRQVENDFWDYCSVYDPRFHHEIEAGLENGDPLTMISAHKETPELPLGTLNLLLTTKW